MTNVLDECLRQEKESFKKFSLQVSNIPIKWENNERSMGEDLQAFIDKTKQNCSHITKRRKRLYVDVRSRDGEYHYWTTEDGWVELAIFFSPRGAYISGLLSKSVIREELELHYGKYWAKKFLALYEKEKRSAKFKRIKKRFLTKTQRFLKFS